MQASTTTTPLYVTRRFRSGDRDLLFSTWMNTLKATVLEPPGRNIDPVVKQSPSVFFSGQQRRIEQLLADAQTRIACVALTDDLDVVLGWAAARGDCLHYVFVKDGWRRRGIAKQLIAEVLPDGFRRFSVRTPSGDSFIVVRHRGLIFDPYALDPR